MNLVELVTVFRDVVVSFVIEHDPLATFVEVHEFDSELALEEDELVSLLVDVLALHVVEHHLARGILGTGRPIEDKVVTLLDVEGVL